MPSLSSQPQVGAAADTYSSRTCPAGVDFEFGRYLSRLPGGPLATPFQSAEFLDAFARRVVPAYDMRMDLCEITDTRSGLPVLMIPYTVYRRGPVRIASLPDHGLADHVSPVFARGAMLSDDGFAAAWRLFVSGLRGADILIVDKIPSHVGDRANPLFRSECAEPSGEMLYLDLDEEFDARTRRKSVFADARSKLRKLNALGVEFHATRDPAECLALFDELKRQRHRRFAAEERFNSLEYRPGFTDFYRHLAGTAHDDGPFAAFCLRTADEIVAICFLFSDGGMANGVLTSIGAEKWHNLSPGMVLKTLIVDWSRQRGDDRFFLGTGLQCYKRRFTDTSMEMRGISMPLNSLGRIFKVARRLRSMYR